MKKYVEIGKHLLDLFLPRRCAMCDNKLNVNEVCLCVGCLSQISWLRISDLYDNEVKLRFGDKHHIQKAACLMYYQTDSAPHRMVISMKYHGRVDVCRTMGRMLASQYLQAGLFEGVDLIVPIPLSKHRKRERGYNQAERIALGMSEIANVRVDTGLISRPIDNVTQTRMSANDRKQNVRGIFAVHNVESWRGKHLLLVDDVITTGATLGEALDVLYEAAPECQFSIASVGLTRVGV